MTPTKLNHKEQNLIKELAKSQKTVAPHLATFQQGLFAKLRDRFVG
jgi:molecular chaperone DnaJ